MVLFNPVFDNGPNGYHGSGVKDWIEKISNVIAPLIKSRMVSGPHYSKQDTRSFPYHNITSQTPPTLVLFGSEDNLVPVETAKRFQKQMKDLNNICQLIIYDTMPNNRIFQWGEDNG